MTSGSAPVIHASTRRPRTVRAKTAGAKANAHRHSGVAFGYVIDGAVCSQITGDAGLKPYRTGDSFFEPPGSQHLGFTNPGQITAKVLVTFVADTGAPLNMPAQ